MIDRGVIIECPTWAVTSWARSQIGRIIGRRYRMSRNGIPGIYAGPLIASQPAQAALWTNGVD